MASSRKHAPAEARVRAFLDRRIFPAARLCLGYSGGLDSTVLLDILADCRAGMDIQLSALHVHHGLSPNADAWAAACAANCARLNVPLVVERVEVATQGRGVEAAAREARYAAYGRQAADFVILAHHLDDQVETFFLRLLRGAGIEGLAGMPAERPLGQANMMLLRPLLDVERAELKAYAMARSLDYCEDESNRDTAFSRNFLRQVWLPRIEAKFPAYRRTLARAAENLREGRELLQALGAIDAALAVGQPGLDCKVLAELGPARGRNLLRYWLEAEGLGRPSTAQLDELMRQALQARTDSKFEVRLAGRVLHRRHGHLVIDAVAPPGLVDSWRWQGEDRLDLGAAGQLGFALAIGQGLAADRVEGAEVWIRLRVGGERLQPDCRRPRRPLKKLLQEHDVPAWERGRLPMLWVGDSLAWVAGMGVDCSFQAGAGEAGWLISWRPPPL